MKKQNDLQWFLIKKFIEILAVVGVVEYLLTFLVNRFVLPNVLLYFFPGVEENPLLLGSGVIFFLSAVLMLLILGALNGTGGFGTNAKKFHAYRFRWKN